MRWRSAVCPRAGTEGAWNIDTQCSRRLVYKSELNGCEDKLDTHMLGERAAR